MISNAWGKFCFFHQKLYVIDRENSGFFHFKTYWLWVATIRPALLCPFLLKHCPLGARTAIEMIASLLRVHPVIFRSSGS